MSIVFLARMLVAALAAIIIYSFIGFVPGTDETSVLMPLSLSIVLAGWDPILILTFFTAGLVTLNLINSIPTALVGLPGGVMSSPMMEHSLYLKDRGLSALVIKKMAAGSLIGVLISLPLSLIIASLLAPFGELIKSYSGIFFIGGSIFLALLSKNRLLSLLSIVPMSILFMGLRHLYWGLGIVDRGVNISTSFFLGITVGPLLLSLLGLLDRKTREEKLVTSYKEIRIPGEIKDFTSLNPLKILSREELTKSILASFLANFLFVLSPVGLTILIGEFMVAREENKEKKSLMAIPIMSSLVQATYISGIVIPLWALGVPLSPVSIGPGLALFNAGTRFTLDNNLHHLLGARDFILALFIGGGLAILISYILTNRYAARISDFVLRKIPHEAILGLFISFIILLSYMDAGLINIFGVLLIGLVSGSLNKMGVNYGVQFMTLYAAPWIIESFI